MVEVSGGLPQRQYVYGLDLISQRRRLSAGLFAVSFYGYDGHGSVRQLTDTTGAVTDTYTYDAFGNILNRTGTTPNNYLYAGEQFDPDLSLYYNRARYLDVRSGRFWSMDSREGFGFDPSSLHRYTYASNDPTNNTDPSGEFSLTQTTVASSLVGTLSGTILGGITGGTRGAIRGAVQGAVFGTVFPLAGAGIGTALLGNAARGVFLVGVGGLAGSAGVETFSLITATDPEERERAAVGLVATVAFAYFGPKFLQRVNTRTLPAEQVNAEFIAAGKSPPYAEGTVVTETTIFKPSTYVRVFGTNGRQTGVWLTEASEIAGLTPEQIQVTLALRETPTHIQTVSVPAGTTMRIGTVGPNFGAGGGGLQFELRTGIPPGSFRPGLPF